MADSRILPGVERWVDAERRALPAEFFRFFRDLLRLIEENQGGVTQSEIDALQAQINALLGTLFSGPQSVKIAGTFAGGALTFNLDGDETLPLPTSFYSTSTAPATKGWHLLTPDLIPSPHATYLVDENGNYLRDENGNLLVSDPLVASSEVRMARLPYSTYSTLQEAFNVMLSPGIITGGVVTAVDGVTARVSAGTAILRVADDNVSELRFCNFSQADFNVPDVQTTHFYALDYNGGNPIVVQSTTDTWDRDTQIPIGSAFRLDGALNTTANPYRVGDVITNLIQRADALGPVLRDASVGGLILGNSATRRTTVTAGRLWSRVSDFNVAAKNSTTDSMFSAYYNGVNLTITGGVTQWDNLNFNNMGTGALVAMGNNKFANLWFFMSFDGTKYGFAYGIAEHNTVGAAANEGPPPYLTQNFYNQALLIGRYIFEKGVDTPVTVESAFNSLFSTSAINNHNQLTGLQGGTTNEYYHLTAAQHTNLTGVGTLASGTYTPTLTNVTNVDSSIASPAQWMRVGNTVTVSGRVDIDPTVGASTLTRVDLSLPVASNFTAATNLGGAGGTLQVPITTALLSADFTNDRAIFQFYSNGTTSIACLYTYTYTVI